MFNQLFKYPKVIKNYLNAPLLEDRLRYLKYRVEQQSSRSVIEDISNYQLTVIRYLHLKDDNKIITLKEIGNAAECWKRHERQRFKGALYSSFSSKGHFVRHAKQWLRFLGRLEILKKPPVPMQITEYADHMRNEKGLADETIRRSCMQLNAFFSRLDCKLGEFLSRSTPVDIDAIQVQLFRNSSYCVKTKGLAISILRSFFRYAEHRGWCRPGIANSIKSPRIYKHATLPFSPSWKEVELLLRTTEGDRSVDIRDRAIILLLAVYGLRDSEVRSLRIDDFDWQQGILYIKHSKLGPRQQFPIVPTIGQSLIRYLKEVRPKGVAYRELFLTVQAPFHPLKTLFNITRGRWERVGVRIKHYGAHSLRHACATRLINQGVSLKTIADQLGHRHLDTTRIYAKVDLSRLREVSDINLEELL